MDEKALLASARAGDLASFNTLVHAYQDVVFSVAYRVLGQPERAADTTRQAFLAAYRALPLFGGGSFRTWLLRIVTGICHEQLSRERGLRALGPDGATTTSPRSPWPGHGSEPPLQTTPGNDATQVLQSAIARLPWEQRVVLVLADVERFNYHEIAGITGVPLRAVKSRLNQARATLRDHLGLQSQP